MKHEMTPLSRLRIKYIESLRDLGNLTLIEELINQIDRDNQVVDDSCTWKIEEAAAEIEERMEKK